MRKWNSTFLLPQIIHILNIILPSKSNQCSLLVPWNKELCVPCMSWLLYQELFLFILSTVLNKNTFASSFPGFQWDTIQYKAFFHHHYLLLPITFYVLPCVTEHGTEMPSHHWSIQVSTFKYLHSSMVHTIFSQMGLQTAFLLRCRKHAFRKHPQWLPWFCWFGLHRTVPLI